jgi:hypothetical protein
MKRRPLSSLAIHPLLLSASLLGALCLAVGCGQPAPQPTENPAQKVSAPTAPAQPALGLLTGEGQLPVAEGAKLGPVVKLSADLKEKGEAEWKEGEAVFKGRWRREEDQILLLLYSEDGKSLPVVLDKKEDGWALSVHDSKKATDRNLIVLKP